MDGAVMMEPREVAEGTFVLPAYLPLTGYGILHANAFLVRGAQPVLVDTGLGALTGEFLKALRREIDPAEIRWVWLTHADGDHTGNLRAVLAEAPDARVATTFLCMAKMTLLGLPVDRVHLMQQGQPFDAGDRLLAPLRPPYYDAPETTGFQDSKTQAVFVADAFGALLTEPAEDAGAIKPEAVRGGMLTWSTLDAPWLGMVDRKEFALTLDKFEELKPSVVLSSHLPPARGMTERLTGYLREAYVEAGGGQEAWG